ncbi:kelch repeat-containing protein [Planctomycetota bacterium]
MQWLNDSRSGLMLVVCIITLFLTVTSVTTVAEDTWIYKADMPTARGVVSGCVLDGRIYVIGGTPNASPITSAVEVYDSVLDAWTGVADMPSARCGHATCAVDGKVYVFGGLSPNVYSTAKTNVYAYDPERDTWTQKADMPYANALCGIAVAEGMIYLMGGTLSVSSPPVSTMMAYDPRTDSWAQKANMPTARFWLSSSVVDGKIYAIGGCTENWGVSSYKHVEVYDPLTNTWTRESDMPTARFGLGTCVVDGSIYAIGGHLPSGATAANEVYDPVTDTWTIKSSMQHKRLGYVLSLIGDRIYAMGGSFPNPAPTVLSTVEEYDTGLGVPSPDLNGDFVIDIEDLIILIEHWGQNDPMCDIAPPPFGDGIVNAIDLELMMNCWGQVLDDPAMIAYWKLDEIDGDVAYDSAGVNDGSLHNNPLWQSNQGMVDGGLKLDGVDDYINTPFVLNPVDGPFSVFAWVKGGAPGQVILSLADGADWLAINTQGCLLTVLESGGGGRNSGGPLFSEAILTDDNWHRVGFTWDGMNRILYVDDIEVAHDTLTGLKGSDGGLYIGASNSFDNGTFWSGLIDDVRIYDRVVEP